MRNSWGYVRICLEGAMAHVRLRDCVQSALSSALALASKCSGVDSRQLEGKYRTESGLDFFDEPQEPMCEEMQEYEEACHIETKDAEVRRNEVSNVMSQVELMAKEEHASDEPSYLDAKDPDLNIPDGQELIDLTAKTDEREKVMKNEHFPRTLRSAMLDESMWGRLFQLTVFLRCGKHGMDGHFLRNAEQVRKKATSLNWHQSLFWIGLNLLVFKRIFPPCTVHCFVFSWFSQVHLAATMCVFVRLWGLLSMKWSSCGRRMMSWWWGRKVPDRQSGFKPPKICVTKEAFHPQKAFGNCDVDFVWFC